MAKQLQQFGAHGLLELVGRGAHELLAVKGRAQTHHMGRLRRDLFKPRLKGGAHCVNLPLDGVAGHRAARLAFERGEAEYGIHMAFLAASDMTDEELPYSSIVALNEHASTLHYQRRDRHRPAAVHSMLIDAGAGFRGYGSDITRTHASNTGLFSQLLEAMDPLQQRLCREVRPGVSWPALHFMAHHAVAGLLQELGVLRHMDAETAVAMGLTGHFLPHGLATC